MAGLFVIPEHDKRLIPEGRFSGPMPWMVAIMIFLTVLASAMGLALTQAAQNITGDLQSALTVQIIEADPNLRQQQTQAIAARLQQSPLVKKLAILPEEQIEDLIAPWLGSLSHSALTQEDTTDSLSDIPLPGLIDVTLKRPASTAEIQALSKAIRPLAPTARLESSSHYIEPVLNLLNSLRWIAFALVLLLSFATAAAVLITTRGALNTHHSTIAVIHLMGGTDKQISRLFQRRIALDALFGGIIGLIIGTAIIIFISLEIANLDSALGGTLGLTWWNWIILALIPILGMSLAMITARITVMQALKNIL